MKGFTSSRRPTVALLAYIDAVLFSIRFILFALPFLRFIPRSVSGLVQDGTVLGALLGNAEHLLLFPIIAALPAPRWAQSAGYSWLVVDMATDILWPCKVFLRPSVCRCATEDILRRRSGRPLPPFRQKERYASSACSMRLILPCSPTFLMDRF